MYSKLALSKTFFNANDIDISGSIAQGAAEKEQQELTQ